MAVDPASYRLRLRRWYLAAALTSLAVPLVFAHALRLTNWYVDHPDAIPGADPDNTSPGGDAMGYVLALPVFAGMTIVALLLPVLWLIARFRAGQGAPTQGTAVTAAILVGLGSLLALPMARELPEAWAGLGSVVVALVVGAGAAVEPWLRRRLDRAGRGAAAQNQA